MEWLANISIKWVLVGAGALLVALGAVRILARRHESALVGLIENLQVVLSVVVVVFLIVRPFLFQAFYIPSSSMEPTLQGPETTTASGDPGPGGDRLIVNKLLYRLLNPSRRDIVVFRAPPEASPEEKEYIKRLIGLPGETVEVVPPRLLIDGKPALRLVGDGNPDRSLKLLKDEFPVKITDNSAELTTITPELQHVLVKVLAHAEPRVFADSRTVRVNGRVELNDDAGRIRTEGAEVLKALGGDAGVKATVYSIQGGPWLILLRGERLEYDPGHVEVNGKRLAEPYVAQAPWYAMAPKELGPDEYFMMGDNRNISQDSHVWGPLKRDRMLGRAEILFWPINRLQLIHWWLLAVLLGLFAIYQVFQRSLARPR